MSISSLFFNKRQRRETETDLEESFIVADELGRSAELSDDYSIYFVHTKWWRFGRRVPLGKKIPFRPLRSDTMQTVAHLTRAIKKEYRDLGYTAMVMGPDGAVSGRTKLFALAQA